MLLSIPSPPFWPTDAVTAGASLPHAIATVISLALLEAVLSADNAIALAGLVRGVTPLEERRRLLNRGLFCAFLLRALMILAGAWILRFAMARLLGGLYLVWLALCHFQEQLEPEETGASSASAQPAIQPSLRLLIVIAGTDLVFSLDSVSAALALSDHPALVLVGGGLGVLMLRFLAGWVIRWMDQFPHLADAAYLTVLAVGLRMLAHSLVPVLVPAPGVLLAGMVVLFAWGFSRSVPRPEDGSQVVGAAESTPASSGSGVCSTPSLTRANTSTV